MESSNAAVNRIREYFDEKADEEWNRLTETVAGRVSFEVHRQFLQPYIKPGMRVLEIGAGPGRFTKELATLGTRITVTDFSEAQLAANRTRASEERFADAVEDWMTVDVRDLSRFADASFDAVLVYGGPLSYVFDHANAALEGMLRVTSRSGVVIGSVMSLLGAWRHFLPAVLELTDDQGDHIMATGDLRDSQPDGHVCQLYRARDLSELITSCGAELLAMSASNWASLDYPEALAELEAEPARWNWFLAHEARACAETGALDGGTHLLFACH